ncbi:MAG: hypothetical protein GY702_09585 [Desulfobulbaceae bacterium]|nr:hypothetical protein [Desulfobulbaceae bacterium]
MGKYKINVTVDLVECDAETDDSLMELEDGSYQLTINENAGESIDDCEAAVLKTAFPAIRKALARHLESVSKKNPKSGKS